MKFIFKTTNLLCDIRLEICDSQDSVICETILPEEEKFCYVDFESDAEIFHLKLRLTKTEERVPHAQTMINSYKVQKLIYDRGTGDREDNAPRYKDAWDASIEQEDEAVKLTDQVSDSDIFNFDPAYKTIFKKAGEEVSVCYFTICKLPTVYAPVVKNIAQEVGGKIIFDVEQHFERVPTKEDIDKRFEQNRKRERKYRGVIASFYVICMILTRVYFASYLKWWIGLSIGSILVILIVRILCGTNKEEYQYFLQNEITKAEETLDIIKAKEDEQFRQLFQADEEKAMEEMNQQGAKLYAELKKTIMTPEECFERNTHEIKDKQL